MCTMLTPLLSAKRSAAGRRVVDSVCRAIGCPSVLIKNNGYLPGAAVYVTNV